MRYIRWVALAEPESLEEIIAKAEANEFASAEYDKSLKDLNEWKFIYEKRFQDLIRS